MIGAEGVDIQSTASGITSIDGKLLRLALALNVSEDGFDTMLMKLTLLPKAN